MRSRDLKSSKFSGLAGAAPQGRRGRGASRPARPRVAYFPASTSFCYRSWEPDPTSACARRCAHGSSWCTRRRPAYGWSSCSCRLLWLWQWEEVEPERLAALVARGTQVECGKLDALVKVAWWCKRQQRIPVEQPAAKGRTLPAMAAAIAPTAAVTRQVRV